MSNLLENIAVISAAASVAIFGAAFALIGGLEYLGVLAIP